MPRFDFKCPTCGRFYLDVPISLPARDPEQCECGSVLQKIPAAPNFILKGSGWTPKGTR